jgi:pectin methylesterase-like acyl-CoA thioesterase
MPDLIAARLQKLGNQLSGRLSMPGDDRYVAATAIWAKPSGAMPRAVIHCRTAQDIGAQLDHVRFTPKSGHWLSASLLLCSRARPSRSLS